MQGVFIGTKERANTFCLEKNFTVEKRKNVVLRVTALGLYFAELNGVRVGDAYLTPGWTSYNKTLQAQAYDVSVLVKEGENVLVLTVNEGWYCGRVGYEGTTMLYGDRAAVCADVIADGEVLLATDGSWTARESRIRQSSLYDGETVDCTAECKMLTTVAVPFDKNVLVPQTCEPVRNTERLAVKKIIRTPKGEIVYDFGQNIAGAVEVKTPENFDGTLILQHAEILVNGNFYTDNLRTAKATDTYTAKGAHTFSPEFTYHGFRYMKLTGAEIPAEAVTALVRHTDMRRTGYIRTDNRRFNRLMDNVVWGQRGNFVDIPTDCPQRDERLGWTGDINVFCTTAAFYYDIRAFMKKWLLSLRNDQGKDGRVPSVVPDIWNWCATDAMWGDCITMVPWKLYQMYGDKSFLSENFDAMKKFISAREQTMENGLVMTGHEFGDWLALDGERLGNNCTGRTDAYFMTNVLHSYSLKILAETAGILGNRTGQSVYREKYKNHLKILRDEYFTQSGRLAFDTVTAQALALQFGIVPEKHRMRLAARLNETVVKHGYRIVTGFIGTPYLLFALADNGYEETARRVLLNNGYPGWLYEADMGATTIWERWGSLRPDGTPDPDGMNSFNHYAYGSISEYVWRRIAGIEPLLPGFKKIRIAPRPMKGISHMQAKYDSVQGKIVSQYAQKCGKIQFAFKIPDTARAEIVLPGETPVLVTGGQYVYERDWPELACEPYTPESTVLEVFENPKAVQAFNEVFGGIFTGGEIAWMKGEPKTLQFMAEFRDMEKKMKLSDFPEMLERANKRFMELTES